jgi:hypothetical protein
MALLLCAALLVYSTIGSSDIDWDYKGMHAGVGTADVKDGSVHGIDVSTVITDTSAQVSF